jgi:hypothetical protein
VPEQSSARGNQVTSSAFEAPFENQTVRLGVKGLNLIDALDTIDSTQLSRMTNCDHDANGDLTSRPGQSVLASGGTEHHSVRKLRDPQSGTFTRIWGIDASLRIGATGGLTTIDTGYSGDPLALLPHRPPLSGDPWMFVGDRGRMRKVRADGLDLPIGLPAPASVPTTGLPNHYTTSIANFDSSDSTEAASWTGTPGLDDTGNVTGVPLAVDEAGIQATSVEFQTVPGQALSSYDSYWGIPLVRNLTVLQGGALPASDDDLMHFWLYMLQPQKIAEIRIYFVISTNFDPAIVPGTDPTGVSNTQAYLKTIRQHDFTAYVQRQSSQITAAETARIQALRDQQLAARRFGRTIKTNISDIMAQRDPARALAEQSGAGIEWVRFGYFEIPLRRGDFQRLGHDATRSWQHVTGLIIYVRTVDTEPIAFRLDELFLHGGRGPDTTNPDAQPYDYRYTNYDPRTGAESNGSPEMPISTYVDSDRKEVSVDPAAFGDAAVRQRIYRRGGFLIDDWYFVGTNTGDGAAFLDTLSDDEISAAGTLPIDHFQPVPTVDDAGNTVLAQPLPALWGPVEGMIFGCGDPYRPGHVYYCLPDQPDHWSSSGNTEVCPPSEELMNGGLIGHQPFVFSRDRLYMLYPNLTGVAGQVTSAPTQCKRGLWTRWSFCMGPGGIYFMAEDGIYRTAGGQEEWISRVITPLFRGQTVHGYAPIDKLAVPALRLTVHENKLYFLYQDANGARQTLVYDILQDYWRLYTFGRAISLVQGQDEDDLLLGGLNQGLTYSHTGFSDDGLAIACTARTGAFSGGRREEKLFGDQYLDADLQGVTGTLQNFLNEEAVVNTAQAMAGGVGRERYIYDSFGQEPQKAHSISTELTWSSATARPLIYQFGYAITLQPDITVNRVTNWDDLGHGDESWVSGITFDVDTGGQNRLVHLERDFGGIRSIMATVTVNAAGRHKRKFSWDAVAANMVRVRPEDDCLFWILYRADWISTPEPPRISKWDIHFENEWDQYYTGLDLYCDTGGLEKRIEVYVDQQILLNPFTGLTYFPVVANGRRVVHLTFVAGRGHVFRFRAIDNNDGLLYSHRWHIQEEPSEQANWNQNFSLWGTRADKWLKMIAFECDTFGQTKSVRIEADGVLVTTLAINTTGRSVVQRAIPKALGRVWRMYPADGNPGRLYSAQPQFDEEPFQLDRWETQETNHGIPGWFSLTYGSITLKSTAEVVLRVTLQHNQLGGETFQEYRFPATRGMKQKQKVTFCAAKAVLVSYLLTSRDPFYLYQEETDIRIQPWGAAEPVIVRPFGNADVDPTRSMVVSTLAAARSGGGA